MSQRLTIAVPKGRILAEAVPLLARAGIRPEPAFADEGSRALRFATDVPGLDLIRVRSFDAATFVAFGAAMLGIVGNDVIAEFGYSELYAPVDLGIGHCRLAVAARAGDALKLERLSHVRVATKYPRLTRQWFAARGVSAECIKLNGAMELAATMGLAPLIVDLVSTGRTLAENGLEEKARILDVSTRLVANRAALKTIPEVERWVERFRLAAAPASQAA